MPVSTSLPDFTPIAIIGMGCRFPKAPNISAYWRMLLDGVDGITEVPASRWDVDAFHDPRPATPCKIITRNGGFVDDVDCFDPYFFGISPREAVRLDPQQRLLLEVTWEAMEQAGIPRPRFTGSRTGVFVGVCTDDYITLERGDLRNIDIYLGTGGARGSTAGRVAFAFGLRGPVAAIDTACSSSLVAIHQACHSLQLGDCEMALAGGANIVLHPGTAIAFSQANLLSPDGHCKAFDASANGFVRSEGAGMVLLKPLANALADGDPVYAVIRSTASNNDGSTSPFMTPSRSGQRELLRHAYERGGIAPGSVQYVEAHGTGTEVGDPIEVGALADVLAAGRTVDETILLGSSKTNLGHLEAAAGAAGVIKTALCLHNRLIPPNLHFNTPNPDIPWATLPFRVPTTVTPWPADARPARAGVNSFGISGTNAHIVLEEAPDQGTPATAIDGQSAEILLLSAHTPESLLTIAASYRDVAKDSTTDATLPAEQPVLLRDLCYSAAVRRTQHEYRLGVVSRSVEELAQKLEAFVAGESMPGVVEGTASAGRDQQPVFVFSGIGTQWPDMGRQLHDTEPVFRESLEACDRIIHDITGWSILEEIARPAASSRLGRIDIMQPAIFSVQVSLAALWRSWGVEPSAVVGHSLGEFAAAFVAGALSLEHAALAVCERSRLMHRTSGHGRMAAVGLSPAALAKRLQGLEGRVSVAVINSATACAVSGDADAVEALLGALESEGVFCRRLQVDVACHSHHMAPLQSEFAERLSGIAPRAATVPLYSTLLGARITGHELSAGYWARGLREPVQFAAVVQQLLAEGRSTFLEISPNPALLTPLRQGAQQQEADAIVAPSLRAGAGERDTLLETAGLLFANGVEVDWARVYPDGRFVPPPPYAWQRERFWFEEKRGLTSWMSQGTTTGVRGTSHPLLTRRWEPADEPETHYFESELDIATMPWLADHRLEGMPLFPAAAYVEIALAASIELFGAGPRVLRDVAIRKPLFLTLDRPTTVQTVISSGRKQARYVATNVTPESDRSLGFHCYARSEGASIGSAEGGTAEGDAAQGAAGTESGRPGWTLLASGYVDVPAPLPVETVERRTFSPADLDVRINPAQSRDAFYASIATGLEFGTAFRSLQRVWGRHQHAVTLVELSDTMRADARSYRIHPVLLDACLHSFVACRGENPRLALPFGIEKIEVLALPDPRHSLWCEVRTVAIDAGWLGQAALYDSSGACLLRITNYESRHMHAESAPQSAASADWLYEPRWREVPHADAGWPPGHWLVVGDGELPRALGSALEARGGTCRVMQSPGDAGAFLQRSAPPDDGITGYGIVYLADAATTANAKATAGPDATTWADAGGSSEPAALAAAAEQATSNLLTLVQASAALPWSVPPRVFVVSTNAKSVAAAPSPAALDLAAAPLAGLARVAAIEARALRITQIDMAPETPAHALAAELVNADAEQEIALRGGKRYALRLARFDASSRTFRRRLRIADDQPHSWRLESGGRGVFDDLTLRVVPRRAPAAGEIEIRVAAVGLNFLDVLKGLNMAPGLPDGARYFGMECVGTVVAVGEGVDDFQPGDEVVAMDSTASGCFRAFLTTTAGAVFRKPPGLSLVEAVTVPVAYQTAYYALVELGRLRRGESILIHSAAGGVGLAALHIARQRGAVIYATAGTPEKREYLKAQGVEYVMDSRTLDFARETMAYSNGRGVDMVLNSLAGEAIPHSLDVLATGGRFLEIGKRDIYADSQLGLLPFQRNLSFSAIDLLRLRLEKPQIVEELTRDVARLMTSGAFQPLPCTQFHVRDVADAFRYMAKGSHIGKIVVTLDDGDVEVEETPQPVQVHADATYLITGGLGALGLAFARHLATQGARHLALLGRSVPNAAALDTIDELRAEGVQVTIVGADVSNSEQLAAALAGLRQAGPPLRGVLHAAGVTDDKTLQQLSRQRLATVFAAKVRGAFNLHTLLEEDALDFFVLFSSAASVLGGAGQANYAAANAFLDALAHDRQQRGLPALSINWGPWADVGMAAMSDNRGARLAEHGMGSIPVKEGTELLDLLLQQRAAQIAVMPIDWMRWAERFPEALDASFLSELASAWSEHGASTTPHTSVRQLVLASASHREAAELLQEHLRRDAVRILRVPEERLNVRVSLVRFGLDSLMAVELKNRIESDFGVNLPAARLLQGPTISELAEWLLAALAASGTADFTPQRDGNAQRAPDVDPPVAVDVATLSDDEVSAMLEGLLTEGGQGR